MTRPGIEPRSPGLMTGVFVNGLRDRGSTPGRVIPKTQKWYLIPPYLAQPYKIRIKCKVEGLLARWSFSALGTKQRMKARIWRRETLADKARISISTTTTTTKRGFLCSHPEVGVAFHSRFRKRKKRKELCPPLHLGVVAIENEAFGSPSTKVTNFTQSMMNYLSRFNFNCFQKVSFIIMFFATNK